GARRGGVGPGRPAGGAGLPAGPERPARTASQGRGPDLHRRGHRHPRHRGRSVLAGRVRRGGRNPLPRGSGEGRLSKAPSPAPAPLLTTPFPTQTGTRMTIPRIAWAAYGFAAAVIVLDQITKAWMLYGLHIREAGQIAVLDPLFNLTFVLNRGVSFGLLTGGETGRWLLTVFSIIVAG